MKIMVINITCTPTNKKKSAPKSSPHTITSLKKMFNSLALDTYSLLYFWVHVLSRALLLAL